MLLPWSSAVIYHEAAMPHERRPLTSDTLRMLRYLLTFLLMLGLTTAGAAQARLPGPQQNIPPRKPA